MSLSEAQEELRTVFVSGAAGQAVSGAIWLTSAAAATTENRRFAILTLVVGGAFIFPLTQLLLRLSGRRASLSRENPLGSLAMQVAFVVPLLLPVAGAATLHNVNWFYPSVMMIVGAHYLPFIFLYGMPAFGVLAGVLITGGLTLAMVRSSSFVDGGWFTASVLLLFAVWALRVERRASTRSGSGGSQAPNKTVGVARRSYRK